MLSLNSLSIYFIGFLLITEELLFSEIYSVLIYASILLIIVINKNIYTDKFQNTIIGLLLSILFISFINYFFDFRSVTYDISKRDVIRDIWYFSRPIFLLLIGYNLGKKTLPDYLIKLIIVVGILSAAFHYLQLIQYGSFDIIAGKRSNELMSSSFIEALLFSIILINLLGKRNNNSEFYLLNNRNLILLLFFITPSVVLYLSRTMFVVIFAVLLFGLELYKINIRSISIASFIFLIIASLFMLQSSDGIFVNKIQRSVTEVGIGSDFMNQVQDNDVTTVWRGYEAYRAVNQIIENKKLVWLWGEGVGSKVDLKFYQKLDNQEFRFIPKLHNGYAMVLFKSGMIGLLLYLYLMYKLIFGIDTRSFLPIQSREFLVNLVRGIGLSVFLVSIVIGGIYNKGEVGRLVLLYGAILGSLKYKGPYKLRLLKIK